MKILLISEFFPSTAFGDYTGGVEARSFTVAKYLSARHEVIVITSFEKNKPQRQKIQNITIYRVGFSRRYSRTQNIVHRISFMISAVIHGLAMDFDLVEGSSFFAFIPAFILANLKKRKKTLFIADTIKIYANDTGKFYFQALIFLEKFILSRRWDGIICISLQVKEKLQSFDIKTNNIKIIYCGAPIEIIRKIKVQKERSPSISCIARLVTYKRVKDLILAVSILKKIFPTIHCTIVGQGEEQKYLINLTRQKKLQKSITFCGFVQKHRKVLRIIKQSDIFCLPSVVEGFGIVTVEAMAAGVPPVLADVPVNREITKGQAQFFKPEDPEDLAQKIAALLSDKRKYQKVKKNCQKIAKVYDWKVIVKQTESYYENICNY